MADCVQWGAQFQGESGGIAGHYIYRCVFESTVRGDPRARYPGDSGHGFRINDHTREMTFEECAFQNNEGYAFQFLGDDVGQISFLRCDFARNHLGLFAGLSPKMAVEVMECTEGEGKPLEVPEAHGFGGQVPKVDFAVPDGPRVGEPVRFQCVTKPRSGEIASYLWDFGDGIPAVLANPEHHFEKPGEHRVTLVIWDKAGRGARVEKKIDVRPPL